jgi:ABC-type enterochelin transport system substrate-binding protein
MVQIIRDCGCSARQADRRMRTWAGDMLIPVTHSKSPTAPTNRHPVSSTSRLFVAAILVLTLLAALASSAARAPVRAEPVEIEHVRGRVSLPTAPETVVVFDLASLDVLDGLGVKVAGVPRGPKPAYLAKYQDAKHSKMEALFEPDYEAVSVLSRTSSWLACVHGRNSKRSRRSLRQST